jgi:hypothetical protein
MQSSPSTGQHLKQATIKSPVTLVAPRPGSGTSPRSDTAQLSSRSPNAHPALVGTLRMGSFYEIDSSFARLREALKPDPKAAKSSALPAVLDELHGAIKVSTLEAEKAFTRRSYSACKLHLAAAKSNQVLMLGKIDSIAEADMSDDRRTGIRSACGEVGAALTRMLIQATTMENGSAQEKILKQKARGSDSDSDDGPPSSPPPAEPTPESHRNSPARGTQKRTQSDADSPVLAQSPGKRQKTDTAISRTTTTITTATAVTATSTAAMTTATTAAVPQSPPAYRPAPNLHIEHVASGATPVGSPSKQDKPVTASSTRHASPQKMRTLSPQARPRPRSQLFVAPPDFTSQVRDDPADLAQTAAPVQVPPGATPTNAVEGKQAGVDNSGLLS